MPDIVSPDLIRAAHARIRNRIRRTPVLHTSPGDLGLDGPAVLKLEMLQFAGSFKSRGAFNTLLSQDVPEIGVTAASGGNHGAAVAFAANRLGYRARIFVPETSSSAKIDLIRGLGAEITVEGARYADAAALCDAYAAETGALQVHPYDAFETIAGQGTLGIEWQEQALGLDTILVAVGGGGLVAGIASWFQNRVRVIGVEPDGSCALHAALSAGRPVDVEVESIAADSLGARRTGDLVFEIAREYVSDVLLVDDDAIKAAQSRLWSDFRLAVEPGGAAALAAVLTGAYRPERTERVGILLCGGNVDLGQLRSVTSQFKSAAPATAGLSATPVAVTTAAATAVAAVAAAVATDDEAAPADLGPDLPEPAEAVEELSLEQKLRSALENFAMTEPEDSVAEAATADLEYDFSADIAAALGQTEIDVDDELALADFPELGDDLSEGGPEDEDSDFDFSAGIAAALDIAPSLHEPEAEGGAPVEAVDAFSDDDAGEWAPRLDAFEAEIMGGVDEAAPEIELEADEELTEAAETELEEDDELAALLEEALARDDDEATGAEMAEPLEPIDALEADTESGSFDEFEADVAADVTETDDADTAHGDDEASDEETETAAWAADEAQPTDDDYVADGENVAEESGDDEVLHDADAGDGDDASAEAEDYPAEEADAGPMDGEADEPDAMADPDGDMEDDDSRRPSEPA